ncbi:MAG: methionine--tRNA ligase subunit beta [Ginsengibacter sp.]
MPPLHQDVLDEADQNMVNEFAAAKKRIEHLIEHFKFRDALFEIIDLSRKGNKYMQDKQPWIVVKQVDENGEVTESAQKLIDNCIHICLQLCANLAIFINPFLPFTAKKMIHMMKVMEKMLDWENGGKLKLLSTGYSLRPPQLLFRKIEDSEIAFQIEKLKAGLIKPAKNENMGEIKISTNQVEGEVTDVKAEVVIKPEINFDDFAKIDLKVGTVLSAEKVQKADKLLKLEVDLGFEKRTIVSGIAQHFAPEAIIGKQVVVVANLAPRKMRGIESNGMILMSENAEGKLQFVNPDTVVENGSGVS